MNCISTRFSLVSLCAFIIFQGGCASDAVVGEFDAAGTRDFPEVFDERLSLTLFAEDPDIVTPIGLAIDERDRLFVLESHTHVPPEDYSGPEMDRIKVFEDRDDDGRPDSMFVFADDIENGMNLVFGPDRHLYVVTSQSVVRLPDRDGDGKNDGNELILEMTQPDEVYDHAAMLGIAATPDGWLYVARGNTGGGNWKMVGSDGSFVSGYGDGGNVIRCRLNGAEVEEVATGFWNPFDLKFDSSGRLLLIDNDPDSRGPNRLVDIVDGGDYGYKSLYGGSGIHPYVAWNGELPGTLPFAVGIGEAPSGMLDATRTSFPADYEQSFLVTIWEESKIVEVKLRTEGVTVTGEFVDLIQGDQQFRPVAFAADAEGVVYFTDWVLREYPNHGKGRIWRLENRDEQERLIPRSPFYRRAADEGLAYRKEIEGKNQIGDIEVLTDAMKSEDSFLRASARVALRKPEFQDWLREAIYNKDPMIRLQAAVVLYETDMKDQNDIARQLLSDPDERIRRMALIWIGRKGMVSLENDVMKSFQHGLITPDLFETYLATIRHLQPGFLTAYRNRAERSAKNISRTLPEGFLSSLIEDERIPGTTRALAIPYLEHYEAHTAALKRALQSTSVPLREAAIFALMYSSDLLAGKLLYEYAFNTDNPATHRADALLALSRNLARSGDQSVLSNAIESSLTSLNESPLEVQIEAARFLRTRSDLSEETITAAAPFDEENLPTAFRDQLALWSASLPFRETSYDHPDTMESWTKAVSGSGDAIRGRRVFFSDQAQCSTCHTVHGWGGVLGPDLSNAGASKSRDQLLYSIIKPSSEITPAWQGWYVRTTDGKVHSGRQIDVGLNSIELMTPSGDFETYTEIDSYGISPVSLMPEGLHYQLSLTDMQDLLSFLENPYFER